MAEWCCRCYSVITPPNSELERLSGGRCECATSLIGAWMLTPWSTSFESVAYDGHRVLHVLRPIMQSPSFTPDVLEELQTVETVVLEGLCVRHSSRDAMVYVARGDQHRLECAIALFSMAMGFIGILSVLSKST